LFRLPFAGNWNCYLAKLRPESSGSKNFELKLRKEPTMDEIKGIARVKFHPGKLEEWKRLTEQAMEIVRTRDSGTLQYEIFFNEDETEALVFERYRDADAAIEHFSNISHLMEPLLATASVTGEVLGTPNANMKQQLAKGGPKLFTPWIALQDRS
jgi:quinol monooxygenase YgiN